MKLNDYVRVTNEENIHYNKTGWVEEIEENANSLAPILVKFKDENGAAGFRPKELTVIGTSGFSENDIVQTRVSTLASDGKSVVSMHSFGKVTVVGVGLDDGSTNGIEVLFDNEKYAVYNSTQLWKMDFRKPEGHKFSRGESVKIMTNRIPGLASRAGWILEPLGEGYIVATARNGVHQDTFFAANELDICDPPELVAQMEERPTSYTLSKENYLEVAEWCGPETRIAKPWTDRPRLFVKTGFSKDPNFRVAVEVGDKLEKTDDGKIQIWVRLPQDNVAWDDDPNVKPEPARFADVEVMEDRAEMLMPSGFAPQAQAIALVQMLHYSENSDIQLPIEDIYVVWFCKTLQNWKAMVSTNAKDDAYYEVTHNGDKNETYVDCYVKATNTAVRHNEDTFDMTLVNLFRKA